jgi:hypothetical protein
MKVLPRTLLPALAGLLLPACRDAMPAPSPETAVVSFTYDSRFPEVCPNAQMASLCFAGCAHHNAPLGMAALLPQWSETALRLSPDGPRRWQGTLFDVPVGVPLRVRVLDIDGCCFGDCEVVALRDLFANGVRLTRVVGEGATASLEFRVGPNGTVIP